MMIGKLRHRTLAAVWTGVVLGVGAVSPANPTQEEVFKSINQNVGSTVDFSKAVPYLLVAAGIVIMAVLINYRLKRKTFPRKANNPAKLSRELCRRISLRSIELKQLKMLAEEQEVEYPLTLILCPSLLGKAIRSQSNISARVDRAVVKQMVARLRQGLVDKA
jgi:hypothetical protein